MNGHSEQAIRATMPDTDEYDDDLPTETDVRYWPDGGSYEAATEWLLSGGMVAIKTAQFGITADEWRQWVMSR